MVTVEEWLAHARELVSDRAAWPKYIEVLDAWPKTAVGKVFKPDLRRSAITRVYDAALENAGVSARVISVDEDKKLGLVAKISNPDGNVSDKDIQAILGKFTRPWAWAE